MTDQLRIAHQVGVIAVGGVGIAQGVTPDLPVLHGVVRVFSDVVAAAGKIGGAAVGHDHQAVAGQVEIAVDGLAQQAAHVGAVRIQPALVELAADRGPADVVVLFDDQHIEAALGKVGRIGQAVVARPYHDGIVAVLHGCFFVISNLAG